MAFFLFLLVNLVLFIRPSELMPELAEIPVYNIAIVAALLVAAPKVIEQLKPAVLRRQPTTICLLGLLPAIILSFPIAGIPYGIETAGNDFLKVVLYFLLLVAVIDTRRQLRLFLIFLAILITTSASLALLDLRGAIDVPAIEPIMQSDRGQDGELIEYTRLQSTGVFQDPNDFAMILISGIVMCFFFIGDSTGGFLRFAWLLPLAICADALWETKSRGGLLALVAGVSVLAYARWNGRRAAIAGLLVLPVVFAGFATRNDGGMSGGTGQQRVEIWNDGMILLRSHPLFGIGYEEYVNECGHVAHNSFVHSYTELGLIGGTLFLGVYGTSVWTLLRIRKDPALVENTRDRWLTAGVSALVAAAATSQFSLSRAYVVPTYMFVGLAVALTEIMPLAVPQSLPQFNIRFLNRLAVASISFLFVVHVYIRFAL
jgi:O-antigen ligase